MATLFTKIIRGEIPSYKIYEDEYTFAFLDIFPQKLGHTLIVPKAEFDHFSEVEEPYYFAIFQTAKKLSKAIQNATNCKRICTAFAGYDVPHCHYHLIPTWTIDDANFKQMPQEMEENLKEMQQKILDELSKINSL